jgi:dicarboxylate transporter 10
MTAVSGFVDTIVRSPSDSANIRRQIVWILPPALRRNYSHVFDAWVQMKSTEGWGAFAQDIWPNCVRCALITCSQLGSYDVFKGVLMNMTGSNGDQPVLPVLASLLASHVAATLASLMDVIKTQLTGSFSEGSNLKVVGELTRMEGPWWLFHGWTPSFARLGPQMMSTLVLLDQHKWAYRAFTVVSRGSEKAVLSINNKNLAFPH